MRIVAGNRRQRLAARGCGVNATATVCEVCFGARSQSSSTADAQAHEIDGGKSGRKSHHEVSIASGCIPKWLVTIMFWLR